MRGNEGPERRFSAIVEAKIDTTLLEGIAASAFLTDVDGADDVLADLFKDDRPADICARIDALRAEQHAGLGLVPAPADRLAALRAELAAQQLDGFLVPLADEHQGEFIARRSQRLAWLTGFGGSAGMAIVLAEKAAIFVDGRYTLQVRDQVDTDAFVPVALAEISPNSGCGIICLKVRAWGSIRGCTHPPASLGCGSPVPRPVPNSPRSGKTPLTPSGKISRRPRWARLCF